MVPTFKLESYSDNISDITMLWCIVLCGVLVATVELAIAIVIPKFNFSLSSRQNATGEWYAEVRMNPASKTVLYFVFVLKGLSLLLNATFLRSIVLPRIWVLGREYTD